MQFEKKVIIYVTIYVHIIYVTIYKCVCVLFNLTPILIKMCINTHFVLRKLISPGRLQTILFQT